MAMLKRPYYASIEHAIEEGASISAIIKYGDSDPASQRDAAENFAGAAMHGLFFSTTPIELLSNDGEDTILGHGTGFYWKHGGLPFLITNWHVLSGRNPFTGAHNTKAFTPQKIRHFGQSIKFEGKIGTISRISWNLEFDEGMIEALQNPPEIDGKVVDLWALPVLPGAVFDCDETRPFAPELTCFINGWGDTRIASTVGDDCYMLGYPLRNYAGGMPPIWKRGSIASETTLGVDGRPLFMVDAATTPGMSGSPIFRKATTFAACDTSTDLIKEHTVCEVIGIYAGRLESQDLQATNLGYGWYRSYIPAVIDKYAKIRHGDTCLDFRLNSKARWMAASPKLKSGALCLEVALSAAADPLSDI